MGIDVCVIKNGYEEPRQIEGQLLDPIANFCTKSFYELSMNGGDTLIVDKYESYRVESTKSKDQKGPNLEKTQHGTTKWRRPS